MSEHTNLTFEDDAVACDHCGVELAADDGTTNVLESVPVIREPMDTDLAARYEDAGIGPIPEYATYVCPECQSALKIEVTVSDEPVSGQTRN